MIDYHGQTSQLPGTVEPVVPAAVRNAVRVMYAGAVACVIHVAVVVGTAGVTKTVLEHKHPHLSAGTLSTLTSVTVIATAVIALIEAVLFIWVARGCGRGRNWARITGTVFAVLGVVFAVYDVSAGRSTASLILSFVVAAIGLASVAIVWQPRSSAYFRYFKRPQF
jgi:drug/metabolite transporter (DMT)-like permease